MDRSYTRIILAVGLLVVGHVAPSPAKAGSLFTRVDVICRAMIKTMSQINTSPKTSEQQHQILEAMADFVKVGHKSKPTAERYPKLRMDSRRVLHGPDPSILSHQIQGIRKDLRNPKILTTITEFRDPRAIDATLKDHQSEVDRLTGPEQSVWMSRAVLASILFLPSLVGKAIFYETYIPPMDWFRAQGYPISDTLMLLGGALASYNLVRAFVPRVDRRYAFTERYFFELLRRPNESKGDWIWTSDTAKGERVDRLLRIDSDGNPVLTIVTRTPPKQETPRPTESTALHVVQLGDRRLVVEDDRVYTFSPNPYRPDSNDYVVTERLGNFATGGFAASDWRSHLLAIKSGLSFGTKGLKTHERLIDQHALDLFKTAIDEGHTSQIDPLHLGSPNPTKTPKVIRTPLYILSRTLRNIAMTAVVATAFYGGSNPMQIPSKVYQRPIPLAAYLLNLPGEISLQLLRQDPYFAMAEPLFWTLDHTEYYREMIGGYTTESNLKSREQVYNLLGYRYQLKVNSIANKLKETSAPSVILPRLSPTADASDLYQEISVNFRQDVVDHMYPNEWRFLAHYLALPEVTQDPRWSSWVNDLMKYKESMAHDIIFNPHPDLKAKYEGTTKTNNPVAE